MAMDKPFIFDQPHEAEDYMERRRAFLGRVWPEWKRQLGLRTALDVGCVVGYFSAFLRDQGFEASAVKAATEPSARPDRLTQERKGIAKLFRRLGRGFRRPAPAAAPKSTHAD
jgi:2-polyprenyl-3-methyl-5-hydroxy-6-metoxy-1,4-benzoquinol methylase